MIMSKSRNLTRHFRTGSFLLVCVLAWLGASLCRAFTSPAVPMRNRFHKDSHGRLSSSPSYSKNDDASGLDDENDSFDNVAAAVLVPGFLTGADEFGPLCASLSARGIPTVAVPMPNWHWLPCLGGRSARPILERLDFTVRHLVAKLEAGADAAEAVGSLPSYDYSLLDCWRDFRTNPGGALQVGGSSRVDEYPVVEPQGNFPLPPENHGKPRKKIAIIAHSAGGWISRVYLSSSAYGGKAYDGSKYVHSLVTLGSPHADAPGPAFDGIEWINDKDREAERLSSVNSQAVAGTGFAGGDWGDLTLGAYGFCCPDGTDGSGYDGDGVTPVFSALAMPGSRELVVAGVTHFCWSDVFGGSLVAPELTEDHQNGRDWYGSPAVLDQWAPFVLEACGEGTEADTNPTAPAATAEAQSNTE